MRPKFGIKTSSAEGIARKEWGDPGGMGFGLSGMGWVGGESKAVASAIRAPIVSTIVALKWNISSNTLPFVDVDVEWCLCALVHLPSSSSPSTITTEFTARHFPFSSSPPRRHPPQPPLNPCIIVENNNNHKISSKIIWKVSQRQRGP